MSNKKIISIRFSKDASDRISEEEWNDFSTLTTYFNGISAGELTELAVKFTRDMLTPSENNVFNGKSFAVMCGRIEGLSLLETALKRGRLDRKLRASTPEIHAAFPAGTRVHFYPPYIITLEPNYQMRVNLNLSEPITFTENSDGYMAAAGGK